MWRNMRTYIVVTLVTLLIWVWAEAETQRADPGPRVEYLVHELPLYVSMPAGHVERVILEPATLHDVHIRVTPEILGRINQGTLLPVGIVMLTVADMSGNSELAPHTVQLGPPGIVGRMADPAPAVSIRIIRPPR
jgi:hypothetical protein